MRPYIDERAYSGCLRLPPTVGEADQGEGGEGERGGFWHTCRTQPIPA